MDTSESIESCGCGRKVFDWEYDLMESVSDRRRPRLLDFLSIVVKILRDDFALRSSDDGLRVFASVNAVL